MRCSSPRGIGPNGCPGETAGEGAKVRGGFKTFRFQTVFNPCASFHDVCHGERTRPGGGCPYGGCQAAAEIRGSYSVPVFIIAYMTFSRRRAKHMTAALWRLPSALFRS